MTTDLTLSLVQETKELLNRGKELLVKVVYNLHVLRDSEEWKQYGHDTFPKFCQEELEISQGTTSKYMSIADYYFETYRPEEIGPVDIEKLWAAAKLPGTPQQNLDKAKKWSREDFKKDKAETQLHDPKWITYCDVCKLSQTNHP